MAIISKSQQQRDPATDAEIRAKHKSEYSKDASRVPIHPIPQLQGPFEESIVEATESTESDRFVRLDAQSRRRDLLESIEYERLCGRKWRQRPGERQAFNTPSQSTTAYFLLNVQTDRYQVSSVLEAYRSNILRYPSSS